MVSSSKISVLNLHGQQFTHGNIWAHLCSTSFFTFVRRGSMDIKLINLDFGNKSTFLDSYFVNVEFLRKTIYLLNEKVCILQFYKFLEFFVWLTNVQCCDDVLVFPLHKENFRNAFRSCIQSRNNGSLLSDTKLYLLLGIWSVHWILCESSTLHPSDQFKSILGGSLCILCTMFFTRKRKREKKESETKQEETTWETVNSKREQWIWRQKKTDWILIVWRCLNCWMVGVIYNFDFKEEIPRKKLYLVAFGFLSFLFQTISLKYFLGSRSTWWLKL